MTNQMAPVPAIDRADLLDVVGAEFGEFECSPLTYFEMNPVSGGLYRVSGTGWSVILKVLRRPGGGVLPMGEPVPPGWGEDPSHYNYWLREAEAFASGALDRLSEFRAPRALGIVERSPDLWWLWLEDIHAVDIEWTLDRYRSVARRLGRFNGSHARPPRGRWVSPGFLSSWLDDFFRPVGGSAVVDRVCPPDEMRRLARLWDERDALCAVLKDVPGCFAHMDAFGSNVLFEDDALDATPVLVDWAFAGRAAIGEEVVQLGGYTPIAEGVEIDVAMRTYDAVLDSYLDGLTDVRCEADPRDVRLAYVASTALRWGFAPYRLVANAADESLIERFTGRNFDDGISYLAQGTSWLLDLADEAYRLASKRS